MQYVVGGDFLYVASGLGVGLLIGMTGVGGGSLMTPLLILFFGVHPATAIGTDLLFAASTKTVGALVHGAGRSVDWRLTALLAAGSVPATIATVSILSWFDLSGAAAHQVIMVALGVVLLVTSIFLIGARRVRDHYSRRMGELSDCTSWLLTILLGFVMGILVSSTSIGAGAIGVTVLMLLHSKMPAARIVGTDIAHAVPLTLVAGTGHWSLGSINWGLLGSLLIGSVPGVVAGSYLAGRSRDGLVRVTLGLVLIVVAIRLLV